MFCAATASIVSGALAERIKLWPFLIFTIILTGLIYPIQASWKWGGGFLDADWGFLDFAGSTVVHSVGGWAALAGAIILGPRVGKYTKEGAVRPIMGSVHLFAGIWGTIAVLFTNPDATFAGQIVPIIIVGVFVFVVSLIVWIILKSTMGIRVSEEDEIAGLDQSELGMEAYPDFMKATS